MTKTIPANPEFDRAIEIWVEAGEVNGRSRNYKLSTPARKALREHAKQLYRQAQDEAGGYGQLMTELTNRGLITWAF